MRAGPDGGRPVDRLRPRRLECANARQRNSLTASIDPLNPASPPPQAVASALQGAQRNGAAGEIPPSPPEELTERIATAARAWEALAASHRHVSFSQTGGRIGVELTAEDGVVTPLSPSALFDLIEQEGAE